MKKHQENLQDYKEFESNFKLLLKREKIRRVTLQEFLQGLSGKGRLLFLIFFVLPASQIPGISLFFGTLITYLGIRISFKKNSVWLPQFLLKKKMPPYFLKKSVQQILTWLHFFQRWSRPRTLFNVTSVGLYRFTGALIALVGISIIMTPPVPLIGFISMIAILCMGIGLLNADGVYLIIGYVLAFGYLALTIFCITEISFFKICEYLKSCF